MSHIKTQVLIYESHSEELANIADTLKVLANDFSDEANALKLRLVARHDALIMVQTPVLKDYQEYLREHT
jgi:hypothetical protein